MANFVVTTTDDVVDDMDGVLSLREAITLANDDVALDGTTPDTDADTITFAASLAGQTITLSGSELTLANDITIEGDADGDGDGDITVSGDDMSRVFRATSGTSTINDLTIRDGFEERIYDSGQSAYVGGDGGGVLIDSGAMLTINRSVITENVVDDDFIRGGGIGGGVANNGTLFLAESTVSQNTSYLSGGAIHNTGDLTVLDSTLSGNDTTYFSSQGGAVFSTGTSASATITNTTLVGNESYFGVVSKSGDGDLALINATVTGNILNSYGNGAVSSSGPAGSFDIVNSIIVGNVTGPYEDEVNVSSNFEITNSVFGGYNGQVSVSDVFATNGSGAAVLADNGGLVQTVALRSGIGNLALDAGVALDEAALGFDLNGDGDMLDVITADAIGAARDTDLAFANNGGTVDLGAQELNGDFEDAGFVVTIADDIVDATDNEISLREAVNYANVTDGANTITFDASLAGSTLTLTQGQIEIGSDITIEGDADGDGTGDITVSGNEQSRIFQVTSGTSVINDLTIRDGFERSSFQEPEFIYEGGYGGGILIDSGAALEINRSVITENSAIDNSGYAGLGNGGGIANYGTLVVTETTISDNTAYHSGGGINNLGDLTILDSTLSGNSSEYFNSSGGALNTGFNASATVTNTTIVGNSSYGAVVNVSDSDLTLLNATVTGNSVDGYGISAVRISGEYVTLDVINSIVLGNSISGQVDDVSGYGVVNTNSLIGEYLGTPSASDVFATIDLSTGGGALADNGGLVQTVALLADADNVALDGGAALDEAVLGLDLNGDGDQDDVIATDATGNDRTLELVGIGNDRSNFTDLGAVEVASSDPSGLVVDTTDDVVDAFDGQLSLREALVLANDGDTITFDGDVFSDVNFDTNGATINLTLGTLQTDGDITIDGDTDGDGDADVVISGDVNGDDTAFLTVGSNSPSITNVDENTMGSDNVQVLSVGPGTVALNGLVITGGYYGHGSGGGIGASSATDLTITNAIIGGNQAGSGGGIAAASNLTLRNTDVVLNVAVYGGGIYATQDQSVDAPDANVLIADSRIHDNTATVSVGGIYARSDTLTLTGSSVVGNSSSFYGGGIQSNAPLTATSSLIADNTAGTYGGGLYLSGDGHTLTNVTLAGNTAGGDGGAIGVGSGGLTADHVTITGNVSGNTSSTESGAVHFVSAEAASTFTNSLIVGNVVGTDGEQISLQDTTGFAREDIDGGNNIIGNDDVGLIFANTDTFDAALGGGLFGVLANNGGPVDTVALLLSATNAALDGAVGSEVETDARGRSRSDFASNSLGLGIADIGAFELINAAPVITSSATFTVAENQTSIGTITASDDIGEPFFLITTSDDFGLFELNSETGELSFADAPNFEAPADADGDNVYEVLVQAGDGNGDDFQTVLVTVTDVAEAQTIVTDPDGGPTTGSDEGDTVAGGTGDDVVDAGLGDDIIVDAGGDDTVNAGGGDDKVGLLSGMNTVSGGDGADLIVGGFGNDDLAGDAGMDVIVGDVSTNLFGSDRITGGTGNDLLEGRGGVDTFVFATGDGDDTIGAIDIDFATPANSTVTGADFVSGVDVIELSGFGLADSDAALAAVTDVSGVATFDAEGTTITFAGLTADDLSADDFILV